jgi:murein DD-endopeptidase MepM/ murein hydrolase activator NlpD
MFHRPMGGDARSLSKDPWMAAVRRSVVALLLGALLLAPEAHGAAGDVAALQVALRARGLYAGDVDGIAGPQTNAAVRRLQARRGLVVDGIAGPATRRALGRRGRPNLGSRPLSARARGWDVAGLQYLLGRAGFPSGAMDGVLGPRTGAALRRFQSWAGLAVDGVAGRVTLARLRRPPPVSPLVFALPVSAPVGDRFGPRGDRWHTGIDFPVQSGTRVEAAGRGCVTFAGWSAGGYGNLVIVSHRLGMTSYYAHLARVAVRPGNCVVAGTPIGRAGSTGHSSGPHLHFEVRLRGAAVPPRF